MYITSLYPPPGHQGTDRSARTFSRRPPKRLPELSGGYRVFRDRVVPVSETLLANIEQCQVRMVARLYDAPGYAPGCIYGRLLTLRVCPGCGYQTWRCDSDLISSCNLCYEPTGQWKVAVRNITGATNKRTVIASILPIAGFGASLSTIDVGYSRAQRREDEHAAEAAEAAAAQASYDDRNPRLL